jgi:hypothetical protein
VLEPLTKTARLTDEIRHLVAELTDVQHTLPFLQDAQLQKAAREWRELFDTLTGKLSIARYFQYDDSLFLHYLGERRVQVVMATCWAATEPLDQVWLDTLAQCEIISAAEYLEALETVAQEGGPPA